MTTLALVQHIPVSGEESANVTRSFFYLLMGWFEVSERRDYSGLGVECRDLPPRG